MNKNQIEEILSGSLDYWDKISDSERQLIITNSLPVSYSQGESIHAASQDCVGMLLVVSGELRTYILSEQGKEFTLFRLRDGGVCILSASCLLQNITFDVFIDAETDCELLLINSFILSKLHTENPIIENFSLKMTADKFSAVIKAMEQMMFMSFERRLATFLVAEYEKSSSSDIPLTQEQIAKYIGSAREVVSRAIKQFERQGYVSLYRGGVKITKPDMLREIAENG